MSDNQLTTKGILEQVKAGSLSIEEAEQLMKTYDDYGFFKWDTHREKRQGFPEVIYGEGKSAQQISDIAAIMKKKCSRLLITRVSEDKAAMIISQDDTLEYHPQSKTMTWLHPSESKVLYEGYISVVSAGTSDLPVAEEAAVTAEMMGCKAKLITDVGVAGIHRLFDQLKDIQQSTVTIVVAGMEGALPSVVGGLVSHPIIAVPTSVGYGTNFKGLSALLSMLNACSSGISVVNIDNGFGGAYNAALIHRLAHGNER